MTSRYRNMAMICGSVGLVLVVVTVIPLVHRPSRTIYVYKPETAEEAAVLHRTIHEYYGQIFGNLTIRCPGKTITVNQRSCRTYDVKEAPPASRKTKREMTVITARVSSSGLFYGSHFAYLYASSAEDGSAISAGIFFVKEGLTIRDGTNVEAVIRERSGSVEPIQVNEVIVER